MNIVEPHSRSAGTPSSFFVSGRLKYSSMSLKS